MRFLYACLPILIFFFSGCRPEKTMPDVATLLEPGIISTPLSERDAAHSPDGRQFFFSVQLTRELSTLCFSEKRGGKWTKPRVPEFSGTYMDIEPVFHPDGRLFFCSNRPLPGENEAGDFNIWYVP
ncbi:MAG TPA: hypothetical protein PLK12_14235, partial [Prolixibacteraceae bacterium]|nr:hypothetical protein [Prolixibacteraceae bacterium]